VKWLLAVALIFSGTLTALRQSTGSIRGIVVNEEGIPMKGATVHAGNNRPPCERRAFHNTAGPPIMPSVKRRAS